MFLYYIQGKCGDITDTNQNAADDDEQLSIIGGFNRIKNEKSYTVLGTPDELELVKDEKGDFLYRLFCLKEFCNMCVLSQCTVC